MNYNIVMKRLVVFSLFLTLQAQAAGIEFFKKVFPSISSTKKLAIEDPIKEDSDNKTLLIAKDENGKKLGYIRDIVTSTGCNDGCLPVIFTLFYKTDGTFLKLLSKEGLTKKYHAPFTSADYVNLEMIILRNPEIFAQVAHPKQMVDAVTSETLKEYKPHVVAKAAYTTLRINIYFHHTNDVIKKILDKKVSK